MKNMKRYIKLFTVCSLSLLFFLIGNVTVFAIDKGEDFFNYFDSDLLLESLPDDVQMIFEKLGIDKLDFNSIFNINAEKLKSLTISLLTGAIESPIKSLVRLISVIIFIALCECFITDDSSIKSVTQLCGILLCTISLLKPVSTAVTYAVASVTVTEKFLLVLIPVLTSIVSVSGNPALALSFQSVSFIAAQLISGFVTGCVVPVVGAVFALDIVGTLMPAYKLNSLTGLVKKSITVVLSFVSTIYVSFLGLKGALANAADTIASKSIKLVITSAVPIVGGALSEAYSGIAGSLVLVKSTVGVFGICAIALINLPSCVQLLFWIFALRVGVAVADLFEQQGISLLLKSLSSTLVLLNVVLLFVAVLFIISTALLLVIKAG